jgi:3'-5' exoribonuclease
MDDYAAASRFSAEEMFQALQAFVEGIESPFLKNLLHGIFGDAEIAGLFKRAPAAKAMHHFYAGGLLEHTLSVTRILDFLSRHYDRINRDLLLTGGMLHDIGKIHELSADGMIDYTDEGRLIGHIVMGLELVNRKMAAVPDFPEDLAMELRHILISHHGAFEYGSPKRPKTEEALMVYFADDLDAKVNAFQEFISDSNDEESRWTPFHRLFERYIYKGPR